MFERSTGAIMTTLIPEYVTAVDALGANGPLTLLAAKRRRAGLVPVAKSTGLVALAGGLAAIGAARIGRSSAHCTTCFIKCGYGRAAMEGLSAAASGPPRRNTCLRQNILPVRWREPSECTKIFVKKRLANRMH